MDKERQKIIVPMSESDIQDLMNGESFDWTFETQNGQEIDVLIRPETPDDYEEVVEDEE